MWLYINLDLWTLTFKADSEKLREELGIWHGRDSKPGSTIPLTMEDYTKIEKTGEGSYGITYRGRHKTTGQVVAMKKIRLEREEEQVASIAIGKFLY